MLLTFSMAASLFPAAAAASPGGGAAPAALEKPELTFSGSDPLQLTEEEYIVIGSEEMSAAVGSSAPWIYKYALKDGKAAYGTLTRADAFPVTLGELTTSEVTSRLVSQEENEARYEVTVKAGKSGEEGSQTAVLSVRLTVTGRTLSWAVTGIDTSEAKVEDITTVALPGLSLLSFTGEGARARLGYNRYGYNDTLQDVEVTAGTAVDTEEGRSTPSTVVLYDDTEKISAAIENNAVDTGAKFSVDSGTLSGPSTPYISVSGTAAPYNWDDSLREEALALTDDEEAMFYDRLPFTRVILGGDENGDGEVTWQDGAIALREIMNRPFGAEHTKNEWMYISFNMSSQAPNPFLRTLDTGKALSYLTDGFGIKIMNKGYQAGGHDDSHGDFSAVGEQQGGAEDFNTLIDTGLLYGIRNGIHINVCQQALDTVSAAGNLASGSLFHGWLSDYNWLDRMYQDDVQPQFADGSMARRLDELKETLPNLDFVYVDTYQAALPDRKYFGTKLAKYLNDRGLTAATEFQGDMGQSVVLNHWNIDLNYGTMKNQSELLRFTTLSDADLTLGDRALLGSLTPGIADWANANSFTDGLNAFYRSNLVNKYLQHFSLMKWTPDVSAELADGEGELSVQTRYEAPYTSVTKDGKLIAKIDTSNFRTFTETSAAAPVIPASASIFIPWSPETEDKIYCYRDDTGDGAVTSWTLPDSWDGVETAYLYRLTAEGRKDLKEIRAEGNQVDLSGLEPGVPYILLRDSSERVRMYGDDGQILPDRFLPTLEEHPYGESTGIADPGFTSGTLDAWTVTPGAEGMETPSIVSGPLEDGLAGGDPRVSFPEDFSGTLSQQVTVTPGRTYTFSVWANSGDREITLRVLDGEQELKSVTLPGTGTYTVGYKPTKYHGGTWMRLRLEGVTVPEGTASLTLVFETEAGSGTVLLDDFRSFCWKHEKNPEAEKYWYYEDFENLDENKGPFVSVYYDQPHTHLTYTRPGMLKSYSIDGVSLKVYDDNEDWDIVRTNLATLPFEPGRTYVVAMDYMTFAENGTGTREIDGQQVTPGFNIPLEREIYTLQVHGAAEGQEEEGLLEYTLPRCTWPEGTQYGYDTKPEPNTAYVTFTATEDTWLSIYRASDSFITGDAMCIVDNFRVTETDTVQAVSTVDPDSPDKVKVILTSPSPDVCYCLVDSEGTVVAVEQSRTEEGWVEFPGLEPDADWAVKGIAVSDRDLLKTGSSALEERPPAEREESVPAHLESPTGDEVDIESCLHTLRSSGEGKWKISAQKDGETVWLYLRQGVNYAVPYTSREDQASEIEFEPSGDRMFHVVSGTGTDTAGCLTGRFAPGILSYKYANRSPLSIYRQTRDDSSVEIEGIPFSGLEQITDSASLQDGDRILITGPAGGVETALFPGVTAEEKPGSVKDCIETAVRFVPEKNPVEMKNIPAALFPVLDIRTPSLEQAQQAESGRNAAGEMIEAASVPGTVTLQRPGTAQEYAVLARAWGPFLTPWLASTDGSPLAFENLPQGTEYRTAVRDLNPENPAVLPVLLGIPEPPAPPSGPTGGGGGGRPSGPSLNVSTSEVPAENGAVTTAVPDAKVNKGTATSRVSDAMAAEIVKQAVENSSVSAVVKPAFKDGADRYETELPGSLLKDLAEKTRADLTVETPAGSATLSRAALSALGDSRTVTVTLTGTEDGIAVDVLADGKSVSPLPGGLRAALPLGEGNAAVLVSPDGTETLITKSITENGTAFVLLDGPGTVKVISVDTDFRDVPGDSWFAQDADFAAARGLFEGTAPAVFSPDMSMSRAMLAAVLMRLEQAEGRGTPDFPDVVPGSWQAPGVAWAAENSIVSGYPDGRFGPDDSITREQMVTMLYRYAEFCGLDTGTEADLSEFSDSSAVSPYAVQAMTWAAEHGLVQGTGGGRIEPAGLASRAQTAAIMHRMVELLVKQ